MSIVLSARPSAAATRVAELLDDRGVVYTRVNVSQFAEPRLRVDSHEVIGVSEIAEVIAGLPASPQG